jgi:hypothetical protein
MSSAQSFIIGAPPLVFDWYLVHQSPNKSKQYKSKQNKMKIDFRAVSQLYLRNFPTVCLFKEHFGATPDVAGSTWEWLVVPPKAMPCQLLWLFYWWKANPLQGPCCKFLGGIDKNTLQKWRDIMETAISNLPVVRK